jgi:nitrous oxidase accessory protein NosD
VEVWGGVNRSEGGQIKGNACIMNSWSKSTWLGRIRGEDWPRDRCGNYWVPGYGD